MLLAKLRESLDTGRSIGNAFNVDTPSLAKIEVLAQGLMTFLASLRDGVINDLAWSTIHDKVHREEKSNGPPSAQQICDIVMDTIASRPVHSVSLSFVIFMLLKLANELTALNQPRVSSSPNSTRSRGSTISSDAGSDPIRLGASDNEGKRSLFSPLRRRKTQTSEVSTSGSSAYHISNLDRRAPIIKAYAQTFAPLIIRVRNGDKSTAKEKKALDARRIKVIQAMFETTPV